MPFVPGRSHDLFLSYATGDDPAWLECFETGLRTGLRDRLGQEISIWKDVKSIRLGDNWQAEIESAVDETAAFLAIVSPGYFKSIWCQRERRRFLEHPGSEDPSARARRFLKIVKLPSEDRAEKSLLPHIQHLSFFRETEELLESAGFMPGSEEFRLRMREAVHAIATLLRTMRRSREAVFVATPPDDGLTEWQALRRELEAQGFNVRPDGPQDPSFADAAIIDAMNGAVVAVFIVTATHDPFLTRQLELARQRGLRLVFWAHPNCSQATPEAKAVITAIRQGDNLPLDSTLLDRMTSRDMIREVLEILKPRRTPPPLAPKEQPRVYLLYDPTTERDNEVASRVRNAVRTEPLELIVPPTGVSTAADMTERHRQLLRDCDGVLVCRSAAPRPDQWLYQTVPEVLFAEQTLKRPPMTSKGFLLGEPDTFPGLPNVIPLNESGGPPNLEKFLQPFRDAGSVSAV